MPGRVGQARRIGVATGAAIGSVLWLAGIGLTAQAADAPCRTPCLAVPAPEAPPPAPTQPPPAAKKPSGKPKPAPAERAVAAPVPPPATVARPVRVASPRCTAITMRAQVGEPVSASDMAYLRSEC